ncbi:MAG: hypothetical protein DME76_20490 [Verrucomicrobia bacterium]|nr:MAG: hypothetical protein DME76_20490 [Verrucomicrobiota bacterium]
MFDLAEDGTAILNLRRMKFIASIAAIARLSIALAQSWSAPPGSPTLATTKPAVDQLIPWLLDEDQQLRGVPFSEVIFDTTGKKVIRFDAKVDHVLRTRYGNSRAGSLSIFPSSG